MLEKYPNDANLVIKHYPLRIHKAARKSAVAALAAANQEKYREISKIFFQNYNKLNDEKIKFLALETGLDMEKFEKDLKDPSINTKINFDVRLAQKVKVRGVPAIFINGKLVKNRSIDAMSRMIDKELDKKKHETVPGNTE
ncbi:MAG: DsbA family protein [Desulfobacula sp.]|nr:DsbA family protein [Desulfobacula sp.]